MTTATATPAQKVDVDALIRELIYPDYSAAKGIRAVVSGRDLTVHFPSQFLTPHLMHALHTVQDHIGVEVPLQIDLSGRTLRAKLPRVKK